MASRLDSVWTFIWRISVFGLVLLIVIRSFPQTQRTQTYQAHMLEKLEHIEQRLEVLDTFMTKKAYEEDRAEWRAMLAEASKDLAEIRQHVGLPPRKTKLPPR